MHTKYDVIYSKIEAPLCYAVCVLIDTHCHLTAPQYADDLPAVLKRAKQAGIERIITVAETLDDAERCSELTNTYDHIFCTAGVHPSQAATWERGDGQRLAELCAQNTRTCAIGEIGLDYHYTTSEAERSKQRAVFLEQLSLSRELILPAVVHCREAVADVRAIVAEVEPVQLVIHCCTEKWDDMAWFVEHGYMLSFTGIVTFAGADTVRDTARHCPREQLMIETDGPYLSPIPHRGKRNEPAYLSHIAAAIANLTDQTVEEVAAHTTKNAVEFFGIAAS